MNHMSFRQLPPPSSAGGGLEGFVARVVGVLMWLMLAALGLVFALSLAVWLAVMLVVSLVRSVITGRPAAVTVLWRRYREMTRARWPQRAPDSNTPRADAASATGAARPSTQVEDVAWREVRTPAEQAAERVDRQP